MRAHAHTHTHTHTPHRVFLAGLNFHHQFISCLEIDFYNEIFCFYLNTYYYMTSIHPFLCVFLECALLGLQYLILLFRVFNMI